MIFFRYIYIIYFEKLIITSCIVALMMYLVNTFETLNIFKDSGLNIVTILKISFFKLPYLLSEISPILALLSTLWTINGLIQQNIFLILFNHSALLTSIIKSIFLINICFGLTIVMCISPMASHLLEIYDNRAKQLKHYNINADNLLFKEGNHKFIHINKLIKNLLSSTTIIYLKDDLVEYKIYCDSGVISNEGAWILENCSFKHDANEIQLKNYILHTNINLQDIKHYFYHPAYLPWWKILELVFSLKKMGIQTSFAELYLYKQLLRPLVTASLGLLPFYFFHLEKMKTTLKSFLVIVTGFASFLSLNVFANILTHYTNSTIFCSIFPIAFLLFVILLKLIKL